jgi:hypothetical protein
LEQRVQSCREQIGRAGHRKINEAMSVGGQWRKDMGESGGRVAAGVTLYYTLLTKLQTNKKYIHMSCNALAMNMTFERSNRTFK